MSTTRRQALAAGLAAPLLLATEAARADDRKKQIAVAALTAVLRLEQTAVVAYEAIANSGALAARPTALLRQFRDQDGKHAQQLGLALDALGAKAPIPPRRVDIPGLAQARDLRSALRFGIALEQRTVAAYEAAVLLPIDANALRTSIGALGADSQHLVVLRQLGRGDPVPTAFERGSRR